MSLELILKRILDEAENKKENIIREAEIEAERIKQEAMQQADALYQNILAAAKADCDKEKQRLIVGSRLEARKKILETKQELIASVFEKLKSTLRLEKFKKEQVLADGAREVPGQAGFYLNKIRQDYEAEVAEILFR
jgi:vacuolar-type H+-ATPase subunit E/Vma4